MFGKADSVFVRNCLLYSTVTSGLALGYSGVLGSVCGVFFPLPSTYVGSQGHSVLQLVVS